MPGAAESADANIAQNANIRYHFDLRDNASLESSPFGSEVYYKRYPLSAYYSDLVDLTKSHYAEMAALLRAVFDVVIHGNGVIYHCSLGRDRTGTLSFILLALLGVSRKHVDMDYELSGFSSLSDAGTPQKRTSANYTGLANYLYDHWTEEQGGQRYKYSRKTCIQPEEEPETECAREYSPERPPIAPKGYEFVSTEYNKYGYMCFHYVRRRERRKLKS